MASAKEKSIPNKHKLCQLCGQAWRSGQREHCEVCGLTNIFYRLYGTGQAAATAAVNRAVKRGEMPLPSTFACVDCGKPAQIYEHRDYNFPLQVEPTCRPCNAKRGYAIPLKMSFDEFMAICRRKTPFKRYLQDEHFEPIRRKYFKESA